MRNVEASIGGYRNDDFLPPPHPPWRPSRTSLLITDILYFGALFLLISCGLIDDFIQFTVHLCATALDELDVARYGSFMNLIYGEPISKWTCRSQLHRIWAAENRSALHIVGLPTPNVQVA